MSSLATTTKTGGAGPRPAPADVPQFPLDLWEAPALYVITCPDGFPAPTIDPAECDRQASLAFLHRLVMGAGGD